FLRFRRNGRDLLAHIADHVAGKRGPVGQRATSMHVLEAWREVTGGDRRVHAWNVERGSHIDRSHQRVRVWRADDTGDQLPRELNVARVDRLPGGSVVPVEGANADAYVPGCVSHASGGNPGSAVAVAMCGRSARSRFV